MTSALALALGVAGGDELDDEEDDDEEDVEDEGVSPVGADSIGAGPAGTGKATALSEPDGKAVGSSISSTISRSSGMEANGP